MTTGAKPYCETVRLPALDAGGCPASGIPLARNKLDYLTRIR
jgi:hypothetical protein